MPTFLYQQLYRAPTWLSVFIGFLLVTIQYIYGSFSENTQLVIFSALILCTGIPHGALDHLIQKKTDENSNRVHRFTVFLSKYLVIMALYGFLWFSFPSLSLLLFLLISAWHFGETDVEKVPNHSLLWAMTRLVYGATILMILFLSHATEVSPGIQRMMGNEASGIIVWNWIAQNIVSVLLSLSILLTFLFWQSQQKNFVTFDKIRVLRLSLILFCSLFLPFLVAFALYFGGWHAFCAFDKIHIYLKKGHPTLSFRLIYLQSLPFTALAIVFLGSFLWYCKHFTLHSDPYVILFIFISIITLPHLIIANQINKISTM